jgi:glucan biosynthesis protein C
MKNQPAQKDLRVDTIRGLALLLMVAGHVIGTSADSGMRVAGDSLLRYLYDSFVHVRMPLFTAISGFVYALRPVTPASVLPEFFVAKLKRLGVPLIVVSTIFFVVQSISPGSNMKTSWGNMFDVYLYGSAHFWFLQSVLCIFFAVAMLDKAGWMAQLNQYLLVGLSSLVVAYCWSSPPRFFSFSGAVVLLPYFLLGLGLQRFGAALITRSKIGAVGLVLAVCIALDQATLLGFVAMTEGATSPLGIAAGLTSTYMLIACRWYSRPLCWLGKLSFEIYLFHVFGTAGMRTVLYRLEVTDTILVFFLCLAAGLTMPVLLQIALTRIGALNFLSPLFFGTPVRKPAAAKPALAS